MSEYHHQLFAIIDVEEARPRVQAFFSKVPLHQLEERVRIEIGSTSRWRDAAREHVFRSRYEAEEQLAMMVLEQGR